MRTDPDPLGDAARETLQQGTARVLSIAFAEGHARFGGVWDRHEGIADFMQRRLHVHTRAGPSSPLVYVGEKLAEKWPWLDDDEDPESEADCELIYIGATQYFGYQDRWTRFGDEDHAGPRDPGDPVFILDALAVVLSPATPIGIETVRDAQTTRYDTTVDLRAGARRAPDRIRRCETIPSDRPWTMRANVWVDTDGLIRRATSTILPVGRARPRRHRPTSHYWHTVEFWDFGLPVDIQVPKIEPKEPEPSWPTILHGLWTRRRDYYRAHPKTRRR